MHKGVMTLMVQTRTNDLSVLHIVKAELVAHFLQRERPSDVPFIIRYALVI